MIDADVSLTFSPLLPIWLLIVLGVAILLASGLGFWRRAKGALFRSLMLSLGLLALANPVAIQEERDALDIQLHALNLSSARSTKNFPRFGTRRQSGRES